MYYSKLDSFKQQRYPIAYMGESGFEAKTIRPYGLHQQIKIVLLATTGNQKNVQTSLIHCTRKCCLHLIALSRILTVIYSTPSANTR